MSLLIDGYNLLHASGIEGRGRGPTALHRSREALLNFLGRVIDAKLRGRTTIVFDAAHAPPGLPKCITREGMAVHFAREHGSADALIEEILQNSPQRRSLLIVSSDHRLHRAARQCGAKAIDSQRWYQAMLRASRHHPQPQTPEQDKPAAPLSEAEVARWVEEFEGDSEGHTRSDERLH